MEWPTSRRYSSCEDRLSNFNSLRAIAAQVSVSELVPDPEAVLFIVSASGQWGAGHAGLAEHGGWPYRAHQRSAARILLVPERAMARRRCSERCLAERLHNQPEL